MTIEKTLVRTSPDAFLMQYLGNDANLLQEHVYGISRSIIQTPIALSDMNWNCYHLSNNGMYIAFEYPEPLQLTRFCHKQMPAVNSDTISIIACLISFYNMKYSKQLEDLLVTLYDSLFDYSMQYSEESHIIFESLL